MTLFIACPKCAVIIEVSDDIQEIEDATNLKRVGDNIVHRCGSITRVCKTKTDAQMFIWKMNP